MKKKFIIVLEDHGKNQKIDNILNNSLFFLIMIIRVKVKPNSSKQSVESFGNGRYLVYLKSVPENGKANI